MSDHIDIESSAGESEFAIAEHYIFGPSPNFEEGVRWYRIAAEKGHPLAQNDLGSLYQQGKGVRRDLEQCVAWYTKAAKQGLSVAQYNLATRYRIGEGVERNLFEAAKWLQLASAQGYMYALNDLATMYRLGEGVQRNPLEAAKLYIDASKQGDELAKKNMLEMIDELKMIITPTVMDVQILALLQKGLPTLH